MGGHETKMTANKSAKAVPHAGGGKTPRDAPERSVTLGAVLVWPLSLHPVMFPVVRIISF